MNRELRATALFLSLIVSGCATVPSGGTSRVQSGVRDANRVAAAEKMPSSSDAAALAKVPAAANLTAQIRPIAHQEEVARPHEHPESIMPPVAAAEEHASLALEDLERMAMANNPTLAQANAQVQAEHGAAYQAGLPFNPVIGEDNVQTHREMLNLGQTTASAVLQDEVELRRDQLKLKDAENEIQHTWRTLVALAGVPQLAPATLQGTLTIDQEPLDYDSARAQLLANSPELAAARQKIRHDEIAVERERAEPIPNVLVEARAGRNFI